MKTPNNPCNCRKVTVEYPVTARSWKGFVHTTDNCFPERFYSGSMMQPDVSEIPVIPETGAAFLHAKGN